LVTVARTISPLRPAPRHGCGRCDAGPAARGSDRFGRGRSDRPCSRPAPPV